MFGLSGEHEKGVNGLNWSGVSDFLKLIFVVCKRQIDYEKVVKKTGNVFDCNERCNHI